MSKKKKLYLSREKRILFGVCAGLAEYFEVDVLIVRLIFLALVFGGGSGLLIYIIMALLIPYKESEGQSGLGGSYFSRNFEAKSFTSPKGDWRFIVGLILVLIGFTALFTGLRPFSILLKVFWPSLLMLIGLMIIFKKN
jgi:phage shock protein C